MEYRVIKDFPNYEISEDCEVRNIKTGRIIKQYQLHGYYRVALIKEKGKKQITVATHRLLAIAFIPNIENYPIIDHINRIKTDNRISNLRWVTYKENANNVDIHKRVHKNKTKYNIGLFLCEKTNLWIVKNRTSKLKVIGKYENIDDAIAVIKLIKN